MLDQEPRHYWIAAALFGAAALFALNRFFVRLRRERLVADTPLVRIRSAAQGYVKVSGRAEPAAAAPMTAPLSSRPCVWWKYKIEQEERDARGNARWRTVERATSVDLFALADEEVHCLVGPVNAEITPTTHDIWYGQRPRPSGPPPSVDARYRCGPWRYTEWLLSVGDRLSVMGELRSHAEVGDVNAAIAEKLHQWKQNPAGLLARFDANHDGQLDAAEWETARAAAAKETQAQMLQSTATHLCVVSEPAGEQPFLIAPLSSDGIERREKRLAACYFVLGLLGVTLCAWAIRYANQLGDAGG